MYHRKLFAFVDDARSSLPDRHQIENDGLLGVTVLEKLVFGQYPCTYWRANCVASNM
jgi:hypothetical protein